MTLKNIALTVCTGIDISQVKRTESGSSVCYKHREVDDFGSFTGTAVSQKRLQSATIDLTFNSWTDSVTATSLMLIPSTSNSPQKGAICLCLEDAPTLQIINGSAVDLPNVCCY